MPEPTPPPAAGVLPRSWEHIPDAFGRVEDISTSLVLREGPRFFLTDDAGMVQPSAKSGHGLYFQDTRHLSQYNLLVDGLPPVILASAAETGYSQRQVMGNHGSVQNGRVAGRCTVEIVRERCLDESLEETLRLTNYNPFPVTLHLSYDVDADFASVFEVRGHQRIHHGEHLAPLIQDNSIAFSYRGADGRERQTRIVFEPAPDVVGPRHAEYEVTLEPKQTRELCLSLRCGETPVAMPSSQALAEDYDAWLDSFAHIRTDNAAFNDVLRRSLRDLRMLWTPTEPGHGYLAAGVPWYSTLFGRDSIIAALQTLPYRPDIARECLTMLAAKQGRVVDPARAEEPGKILHELREDELSRIGELPYQRYYGSVDSTPLFLLLAAEYYHWTGNEAFLRALLPDIEAALAWIDNYGDLDGDRLLEYRTDAESGLRNQGWKDSVESVMHADGVLCEGPIALVEVQGYVYAAYRRLAPVLERLGLSERASELGKRAEALQERVQRVFWRPGASLLAIALDGDKRPAEVMSSNAGQALWSGIVTDEVAAHVCRNLFGADMFSGWGIRTLSDAAVLYNPLGYHLGTVWPHDNGLIALGLKRYGFSEEVNTLATALFDAARQFPGLCLPELFGGQARDGSSAPVPYPVACRPQAWTAGTVLHLLQAILGLVPDAGNDRLYVVAPKLPEWLREVHLDRLPIGRGHASLHFTRQSEETVVSFETYGPVEVMLRSDWPG